MNEPAVSAALGAWLVLRRLERGRVTHADGMFLDDGRPLPGYLTAPLRALLDQGLARADPPRLHLTDAGHAAYEDLLPAAPPVARRRPCRPVRHHRTTRGTGSVRRTAAPPRSFAITRTEHRMHVKNRNREKDCR